MEAELASVSWVAKTRSDSSDSLAKPERTRGQRTNRKKSDAKAASIYQQRLKNLGSGVDPLLVKASYS